MTKTKTLASTAIALLLICAIGGWMIHHLWPAPKSENSPPSSPQAAQDLTPSSLPVAPLPADTPNQAFAGVLHAVTDGDAPALLARFDHPNAQQEESLRQIAAAMAIGKNIRAAVAARFGDAPAQKLMRNLGFIPPVNLDILDQISPTIDGDTAQLDLPRLGIIKFVKVDGVWKLTPDVLADFQSGVDFFAAVNSAAPQFQNIIADIAAGKYQTVPEVRAALQQVITRLRDKDPVGDPPDRPAVLAPGKTPQETIAALVWAQLTGDQEAAITCFANPSANQQAGLRVETELFAAGEQIRSAVAEKFGLKIARNSILTLGLDSGLSKQMLNSLRTLPDSPTTDHIHVDLPTIGVKMDMAKSDGVWKIEPLSLGLGGNLKWAARLHDYYLPKYLQIVSDIKAGAYHNPQELQIAIDALHQEMVADQKQFALSAPPK